MRLSVKSKLAGAFGIVIALTATVGGVAYVKLSTMNDTIDRIMSDRVSALQTATTVRATVLQGIRSEKSGVLDPNDANVAKDVADVKDLHKQVPAPERRHRVDAAGDEALSRKDPALGRGQLGHAAEDPCSGGSEFTEQGA